MCISKIMYICIYIYIYIYEYIYKYMYIVINRIQWNCMWMNCKYARPDQGTGD